MSDLDPPRASAAQAGRSGFTLIEVLVVMAIMALIVGILMPVGSRQREHAALANGARQIAEALRLTRSRAIVADRPMVFLVDVEKDLYRAGTAAPAVLPRDTRIALTTTADQVLNDKVGTIRFYADGSSTGGGVALSGAGGRYDVLVDWLTGGVSIHERGGSARR